MMSQSIRQCLYGFLCVKVIPYGEYEKKSVN